MRWLTKDWWQYLLARPCSWTKFWCRVKGHPEGPWWYNVGGMEPDMRCRNCDDDIG